MKLEIRDLCAAYGKQTVLQDVSFPAEDSGITVLLGRNGAGKSTLLACLTGQKGDHRGAVLLDGKDCRSLTPSQRARLVAYLPQELPAPRVTVRELVSFGRAPYVKLTGKLTGLDETAVDAALSAVGMTEFAHRLVDSLSGGERKKAFFAMVLAQDAPLIVLDEPTAHLDAASRFEFLELVEQLCREMGKTFLVVMHELPEALRFADRVAVLHQTRLVFHGSPEACVEENIPERCFDVRITGNRETGYAVLPK